MNKRQLKKKWRNSSNPYSWYVCYNGNCPYNFTGESCKFHTCKLYNGTKQQVKRFNLM